MTANDSSPCQKAGRLKDARGRSVTTLDPIAMNFLRQTGVIPVETLRRLADEIGVGWSRRVRVLFFIAVVCLGLFVLVTILGIIADMIKAGRLSRPPIPVLVVLPSVWIGPFVILTCPHR